MLQWFHTFMINTKLGNDVVNLFTVYRFQWLSNPLLFGGIGSCLNGLENSTANVNKTTT